MRSSSSFACLLASSLAAALASVTTFPSSFFVPSSDVSFLAVSAA
jgi:hypothetical protein